MARGRIALALALVAAERGVLLGADARFVSPAEMRREFFWPRRRRAWRGSPQAPPLGRATESWFCCTHSCRGRTPCNCRQREERGLRWRDSNRPNDSDFDLPGSRERQRVVIRPLAGARGYRIVQSSKDVGLTRWPSAHGKSDFLSVVSTPTSGGSPERKARSRVYARDVRWRVSFRPSSAKSIGFER